MSPVPHTQQLGLCSFPRIQICDPYGSSQTSVHREPASALNKNVGSQEECLGWHKDARPFPAMLLISRAFIRVRFALLPTAGCKAQWEAARQAYMSDTMYESGKQHPISVMWCFPPMDQVLLGHQDWGNHS